MKKKITAALACAIIVLSLAGCADQESGRDDSKSERSSKEKSSYSEDVNSSGESKPSESDPDESKPESSSGESSNGSSAESKPEKPPVETVDWSKIEYAEDLDFIVEDAEGGVVIAQYIGTETKVKIPQTINGKTVVTLGKNWKMGESYQTLFPSNVTDVNIPNSVTDIKKYAFDKCNSLKSVVIPENYVTDSYAFLSNCPSKNTVYTFLGNTYCLPDDEIKLKDALFPGTGKMWIRDSDSSLVRVSITIKDVVIPDNVTSLSENAFYNCDLIENITIPVDLISFRTRRNGGSVKFTEQGTHAYFNNCPNLKSVTFAEGVTKLETNDTEEQAIDDMYHPDNARGIFYNCPKLETINLPESLTEIGVNAFAGCTALKSMTIPGNVKELKTGTFLGCTALESVTLPDGLTKISEYCFGKEPPKNLQVTYKGVTYKSNQLPNLYRVVNGN